MINKGFRPATYAENKNKLQKFLVLTAFVFVLLFILSFSFPHEIIPDIGSYTTGFFEAITRWFADNILQIKKPYTGELISDSTGYYVNALLVFLIAIKENTNIISPKYRS